MRHTDPACCPILHLVKQGMIGAEIGVSRGQSSIEFLLSGCYMIFIDPWAETEGYDERLGVDGAYKDFVERIRNNSEIAKKNQAFDVYRMTSESASKHCPPEFLDFAFIDANHKYDFVKQDIELWWPKIRPGGWLMGHDYDLDVSWSGVKRAVDQFGAFNDLIPLVFEPEDPKQFSCWAIRKPGLRERKGK